MRLILSSEKVCNTVMSNESGQVLYKSAHPVHLGFSRRITTIQKIKPSNDPTDMRDQFEVLAHIHWHTIGSTIFRMNGQELQSDTFFPRHGILGRKRTFTGPDGHPYKWEMWVNTVVLSRDDETQAELARYHRGSLGITGPRQYPYLDIQPEVLHMLDMIVVTFVYIEQLHIKRDRKGKRGEKSGADP